MLLFIMINKIEIIKHMFLNILTMKELLDTFWIMALIKIWYSARKKPKLLFKFCQEVKYSENCNYALYT